DQRILGIKGLRGVGKTTIMLQYLKNHYENPNLALYVTADAPWFYSNSLYDVVEEWSKLGGKLLLIDEIHKYPLWYRELKVSYEAHPEMQFIFSASSAYDVFKGEADLSRRAIVQELPGMSFREYLQLSHNVDLEVVSLDKLLAEPSEVAKSVNQYIKPIPLFKQYLKSGYFPFSSLESDAGINLDRLIRIVNTILENDLAFIEDYSASNVLKMKKLLGIIAESAPFEPNISKIAQKLKLGRNTIYNYLKHLADARLLNYLQKQGKGIASLQ
ncbi:MAG: AAA family ATPase, partial [Bacteroidetes bacterium SW_10_40_5]